MFPGSTPIILINGDKLLDLLVEHEIGTKKRNVELYEDFFRESDGIDQVKAALESGEASTESLH